MRHLVGNISLQTSYSSHPGVCLYHILSYFQLPYFIYLSDDGKYPTPMFVYSIGTALCRFPGNLPDMNLNDVTLDTQCFLTNRRAVLALGANIRENTLYFAENATKTISKVKLSRGESPEIIIGGTGVVEG